MADSHHDLEISLQTPFTMSHISPAAMASFHIQCQILKWELSLYYNLHIF